MIDNIMMSTMMNSMAALFPEVEPTTPISQYVNDELDKISSEDDNIDLIKTILLTFANKDPEKCESILVNVHNSFGKWYSEKSENAD